MLISGNSCVELHQCCLKAKRWSNEVNSSSRVLRGRFLLNQCETAFGNNKKNRKVNVFGFIYDT